jgi:hypothetical protein
VAAWSEEVAARRALLERAAAAEPDVELAEDIGKILDGATASWPPLA